jgi:hypothetical protein
MKRRSLFAFGNAVCSLSASTYNFTYNETAGGYTLAREPEANNETDTPVDAARTDGGRLLEETVALDEAWTNRFLETNDEHRISTPEIVEVRACWCTQYFALPMEFCPASYDTCRVRGSSSDPVSPAESVSCYRTTSGDTFVRSFWPVAIFWVLALAYALFFSEPGRSAQHYVWRKLCTSCRGTTEEQQLRNNVDRMLRGEPERAAFLYRQYVLRQRRRRNRRSSWWWPFTRETGTPDVETQTGSRLDPNDCRDRLILKTKKYVPPPEIAGSDDEEMDTLSSSVTPTLATATRDSTAAPRTWLPRRFNSQAEQVTFDEMDDEMELGVRCAICLARLVEGDVIGDISCGHTLHKDVSDRDWLIGTCAQRSHVNSLLSQCLKDWLRRKNRCPLCQQQGVASLLDTGRSRPLLIRSESIVRASVGEEEEPVVSP